MNTTRHATGSPVLSRPSTSSSRRFGAVGCERLMATEGRYGKHEAMESARRPRLFYTVFLKHFIKASGYCAVVSRAAMGSVASPLVLGPAIQGSPTPLNPNFAHFFSILLLDFQTSVHKNAARGSMIISGLERHLGNLFQSSHAHVSTCFRMVEKVRVYRCRWMFVDTCTWIHNVCESLNAFLLPQLPTCHLDYESIKKMHHHKQQNYWQRYLFFFSKYFLDSNSLKLKFPSSPTPRMCISKHSTLFMYYLFFTPVNFW